MSTIGIIGFGVVGTSILSFLNDYKDSPTELSRGKLKNIFCSGKLQLLVWDKRELAADEQRLIEQFGGRFIDGQQTSLDAFITTCEVIFASPGINIEPYKNSGKQILCELDLFSLFFTKPVVAITGSLGKTTTTKLIGELTQRVHYNTVEQQNSGIDPLPFILRGALRAPQYERDGELHSGVSSRCIRTAVGGNIGIGMLDLVKDGNNYDLGVLELSSFQLDVRTTFAPDIAIWTNFYPNHLDRHGTMEQYFQAKFNLIVAQHKGQLAILSAGLLQGQAAPLLQERLPDLASDVCFTSVDDLDPEQLKCVNRAHFYWMYVHQNSAWIAHIVDRRIVAQTRVFNLASLPDCTFRENWLQVLATIYFLRADMTSLETVLLSGVDLLDDHHHRVEHFATIDDVDFYEDSKSTVIQATQAAAQRLAQYKRPLIVILGGMSKGVDRRPLMDFLKTVPEIKKVYCFGQECDAFNGAVCCEVLEEVVHDIKATMQSGDIVLFSPSGASFDFFDNYKHRGQVFKDLVLSTK